jgi:hypothetical protein
MRTAASKATLVLLLFAAACAPSSKQVTDPFVVQYVQSILDESDFYKQYSTDHDLELIRIARPKLKGPFEIASWDQGSPGSIEYSVAFSNGAVAIVNVREQGGSVDWATMTINRQPPAP